MAGPVTSIFIVVHYDGKMVETDSGFSFLNTNCKLVSIPRGLNLPLFKSTLHEKLEFSSKVKIDEVYYRFPLYARDNFFKYLKVTLDNETDVDQIFSVVENFPNFTAQEIFVKYSHHASSSSSVKHIPDLPRNSHLQTDDWSEPILSYTQLLKNQSSHSLQSPLPISSVPPEKPPPAEPLPPTIDNNIPSQDNYLDAIPFSRCDSPHDLLYKTLPTEPTPPTPDYAWNEIDDSNHQQLISTCNEGENVNEITVNLRGKRGGTISRKILSQYYYLPINQAAKELNVSSTHLKKKCRKLGIQRWPYRTLSSLQILIKNIQEQGEAEKHQNDEKRRSVIEMLEREMRKVEEMPDSELGENIIKLRNDFFTAKYKKRRIADINYIEP